MRMKTLALCGALIGAIGLGGVAVATDISVCQAQLADGSTLDTSIDALEIQGSAVGIARTIAGLQSKRLSALDKLNALKCSDANQKLDDLVAGVTGNRKIVSGGNAVVDAASAAQACVTELIVETGCL